MRRWEMNGWRQIAPILRTKVGSIIFFGVQMWPAAVNGAELFRYMTAQGELGYSNVKPVGVTRWQIVADTSGRKQSSSGAGPAGAAAVGAVAVPPARPKSPAAVATLPTAPARSREADAFPRVLASTQRERDDLRYRILTEELDAERQALRAAEERSAAPDTLARHHSNIEALNREIERVVKSLRPRG